MIFRRICLVTAVAMEVLQGWKNKRRYVNMDRSGVYQQ
jgi:hypothetical protein